MATNVLLPKWGMSMEEGQVNCWLKQEGDPVEKGEAIVEVESSKATDLVESPASGILARILVAEGATVPIATVIAVIASPGEAIDGGPQAAIAQERVEPSAGQPAVPDGKATERPRRQRRVAASPAARRLAEERQVDLSTLTGTGPDGMIVAGDVETALAARRPRAAPISKVVFFSQGHKLDALLYLPKEYRAGQKLPGVVLCLGFTYLKELLAPDIARRLSALGYACLLFDYRGFGASEGERGRLLPLEQVADIRAAVTYLVTREEIDAGRIGLLGISMGGAHAISAAGLEPRLRAVAAIAPIGDGRRWLKGARRYVEWVEFTETIEADRKARVLGGAGARVDAWDIISPDPASRGFLDTLFREFPAMRCQLSFETAEALLDYSPESVVRHVSPRPLLLVHGTADCLVPPDESRSLFAKAGEPRELALVEGMGHFDWGVPQSAGFDQVMTIVGRWLGRHLGPKGPGP